MKKLILKVRPPTSPSEASCMDEEKGQDTYVSMWNEDGSMRMMPGWSQIERQHQAIGRTMPYARKLTKVTVDDGNTNLLWSERSEDSKQVMMSIDEILSPSEAEPLPLSTEDSIRVITRNDGTTHRKPAFKPFPIYNLDRTNDPRARGEHLIDRSEKQEYTCEILYPLFAVQVVERVEKLPITNTSASTKNRRGVDWEYGDWSLNDNAAGIWEASHPDVQLIRFEDGRWSHPDFYEKLYVTSRGSRYKQSFIKQRNDLGVFSLKGVEYVWKLSPHCQDVQLYETHMDRKIRRYMLGKSAPNAAGEEGEG